MNRAVSNFFGHNKKGTTKKPKNTDLKSSQSKIMRTVRKKPSQETVADNRGTRERDVEQISAVGNSTRQKQKQKKTAQVTKKEEPKPVTVKPGTPVCYTPPGGTPLGDEVELKVLSPVPSRQDMKRGFSKEAPSTRTTMTTMTNTIPLNITTSTTSTQSATASSSVTNIGHEPVWIGASVAKTWMDKAEFSKTKEEFEKISNITVNIEKDCKKWKANKKWNQSEEYPAFDSNLVKSEEYVNMSHVEVPLHRNLLMAQIPLAGSEEAFWKVVFDNRAMCIHLLIGDGEKVEFFPLRAGDFMHYGSMFVNNRKVDNISDDITRFAIEVLPSGCSNSIISTVTVIKNWNMDLVHAKYACVIKETIELNNFLSASQPDETALVISKHGAGRAGYFVALTIAITKMDQKIEPNILEIVKAIRAQRPKSVESLPQYASLYISMFYFIKRKMSKTAEGDKKAAADPHDPLCRKAIQLTNLFTKALLEEAAAQSTRSTMTSVL